jgi:uncharacterized damage-inducible protein DinB
MPVSADTLRTHIEYTAWASGRLVSAAAELSGEELTRDFGTADKSVLGTLVHVFAADRIWLARLEGSAHSAFTTEADYRLEVLQKDWPALYDRWRQWAARLTDESARAQHSYQDLQGRQFRQPVWMLVLHVVNHGTYHRGLASGLLRALGHKPPALDLIFYYREREKAHHGQAGG